MEVEQVVMMATAIVSALAGVIAVLWKKIDALNERYIALAEKNQERDAEVAHAIGEMSEGLKKSSVLMDTIITKVILAKFDETT